LYSVHLILHHLGQIIAWLIALFWTTRVLAAARGLPSIPDLALAAHDLTPTHSPSLTVIVPARNEAADITACLQSLLAQDYKNLRVLAVDDRSTDRTGALMDALSNSSRLEVLHITELPPDWLGKTHAMALAASHTIAHHNPQFLLFTDADILFAPSALRRALAHAQATQADHLVLAPTTIIRRWDEAAVLSFFSIFGLWAARPWLVANPRSRDAIGIGAFNLLRTPAYLQVGGFQALRMEIVEDLGLARRIKQARLRQRFAFGPGLVRVHWASGLLGIVNVMTKNIFAACRFRPEIILLGCAWLIAFCVLPFVVVWLPSFTLPAALAIAAIVAGYFLMQRGSGLSGWNGLFAPFAALAFTYALLRSMLTTLTQRGVTWRGTFYPLADLRKHTPPLFPRRNST
jgi:glycosyltransferase involved in cell wall biosynthesis